MEKSDEMLIDAHCHGDSAAFAELVRRYGNRLLGYLVRMSGSRDQAEDLFQETFRKVYQKAHTFRGPRFKSWLFKIATRVAIDAMRKQKHIPAVSLNQQLDCGEQDGEQLGAVALADNTSDPADEAMKAEQTEQVKQAIEMLPAKQRATLVLAYYQQLSYSEVAAVLGCSVGTVKTQMFRALRALAEKLPDMSGVAK